MSSTSISQKIIPNRPQNIPVRTIPRRLAGAAADGIHKPPDSENNDEWYLGLAVKRSPHGRVAFLALATVREVLVISIDAERPGLLPRDRPFEQLLRGEGCTLVGFDMARLAVRISDDLKLRLCGIDLSTAFGPDTRNPSRPSKVIADRIHPGIDTAVVDGLWNDDNETIHRELCLRAWLSVCVAEGSATALSSVAKVDTSLVRAQEIAVLGELVRQTYILEDAIPKESPSEFNRFQVRHDGTLELQNARYKTRVRSNRQPIQTVIMTNDAGDEFVGQARGSKGRTTNIRFTGQALSGTLQKVRVVGRPALTNPETARDELLLHILQGKASLRALFIQTLWFPTRKDQLSTRTTETTMIPGLNPSQARVASQMVSSAPLVITHGPPGTGKTTTIAAAASIWDQQNQPTWIVAHSNVAVKNIAETLFKKGVDFKILVAKEFHFEWHEHIYAVIQRKVLVSDDLLGIKNVGDTEMLLGGSCIMLSTLSMLSNPTLDRVGVFRVVPVGRLVVDEASQIKIEDFLHVFQKFQRTLAKVCFFGDPEQLPPYGKDKVPELRTIFDVEHLKGIAGFLDTQYRMPVPLGDFISRNVYDGKLKSEHSIRDTSCVSFVDVSKGEEGKSGFSWTNAGEIQTIIHLVKTYYKYEDFCIITPYDAQRAAIERQLKLEDLPWERVFNVDSFQGNEADFVLVSVVRSGNQAGFLTSTNRMNVLLTRCKKGLVIVTSRSFLEAGGRRTLLGSLERYWMHVKGETSWVDWKSVSEGKADLPSAPGPNREKPGYLFRHVPGASSQYSAVPVVQQRTFDTKSLFRPLISKPRTEALSYAQAAGDISHSSSGSSSPTIVTPISSGSRPWDTPFLRYSFDTVVSPSLSSRTPYTSSSFHAHMPKNYEEVFPSLPMVDVPHKKPSSTSGLASYSLLLERDQTTVSPPGGKPASVDGQAQNQISTSHFPKTVPINTYGKPPLSGQANSNRTYSLLPKGDRDNEFKARPDRESPAVIRLAISQAQIARAHPHTSTTMAKVPQWKQSSHGHQDHPKAHPASSFKPPRDQNHQAKRTSTTSTSGTNRTRHTPRVGRIDPRHDVSRSQCHGREVRHLAD